MTLATLTDKERKELLCLIAEKLNLDPHAATPQELLSAVDEGAVAVNHEYWSSIRLGPE